MKSRNRTRFCFYRFSDAIYSRGQREREREREKVILKNSFSRFLRASRAIFRFASANRPIALRRESSRISNDGSATPETLSDSGGFHEMHRGRYASARWFRVCTLERFFNGRKSAGALGWRALAHARAATRSTPRPKFIWRVQRAPGVPFRSHRAIEISLVTRSALSRHRSRCCSDVTPRVTPRPFEFHGRFQHFNEFFPGYEYARVFFMENAEYCTVTRTMLLAWKLLGGQLSLLRRWRITLHFSHALVSCKSRGQRATRVMNVNVDFHSDANLLREWPVSRCPARFPRATERQKARHKKSRINVTLERLSYQCRQISMNILSFSSARRVALRNNSIFAFGRRTLRAQRFAPKIDRLSASAGQRLRLLKDDSQRSPRAPFGSPFHLSLSLSFSSGRHEHTQKRAFQIDSAAKRRLCLK